MLDSRFLKWLKQGTPEETYIKQRAFLKYLREYPEMYEGEPNLLDQFEASLETCQSSYKHLKQSELELKAAAYELKRAFDETMRKEETTLIPLFGRRKKIDSH